MADSIADKPRCVRLGFTFTYAAITVVFAALLVYACTGPRGSDQFWYLGDTTTILTGDPPLTNTVYPGLLLRNEGPVEKSYFAHHSLVLYMVLPFAEALGAYRGWIAFNFVSALIVASLIAAALHRLTTPSVALIGYGSFLLLPLTVWQAGNMLQEVAFCLMTALLTVFYVFGERILVYWVAIFAVCGIAVLCHPLFLPLALVLPLVFLWQKRRVMNTGHILLAGLALGIIGAVQVMKPEWFPAMFPTSLKAIALNSVPGVGNMEWFFRAELPPLTPGLVISKMGQALKHQLAVSPSGVFLWPANAMILGSVLLIGRRKEDPRFARLVSATTVFIGLFAFLVSCHTHQFRSALIITPAILISTAVYAHRKFKSVWSRYAAVAVPAIALLFLTVDISVARHLHLEGQQDAAAIEVMRRRTETIGNEQRVLIEVRSSGEPLMLAYALRPRECLILKEGYLAPQMVERLLATFAPTTIFCRPDSDLPNQAGATFLGANWPGRYHEFAAYQIQPPIAIAN